jgi:DNA polymerase-3 subunit beta
MDHTRRYARKEIDMEQLKLAVPAEYIGVLKLFIAKNDVRYYLHGIALEIGQTESRLIATDGHRLGVFRLLSDQPAVATPFTIILPTELVEHIKPNKGEVEITIGPEEQGSKLLTLTQNGVAFRGLALDGTFPDWRRVIPREISGVAAQFNLNYIGDLGKATRILRGKNALGVGIGHNGNSGALIDLADENFVGVLMPMRGDAPKSVPAWVFGDLRADSPQAEAA